MFIMRNPLHKRDPNPRDRMSEAWKDSPRPCFQCGYDFIPEERFQNVCPDCIEDLNESMYGGIDDPDDPDDDL